MARDGFRVFDSDMHVLEPPDAWQRYIERRFRDRAPRGMSGHPRDFRVEVDGTVFPDWGPNYEIWVRPAREEKRQVYAAFEERRWDAVGQLRAMDAEGVDITVLFPTRGLFVLGNDRLEPAFATAIARAYNDWLAEFCSVAPHRLHGAAMIPPHDLDAAVKEARRAVVELGFKALFLRPNVVAGRNWHDPYYDSLWREAEELQVPVCFHEGGRVLLPQPGANFSSHMLWHATNHPLAMMLAVADIVGGGVLERFPRLKAAFLEANCSWAPWFLWRLDEHYEISGRHEYPKMALRPSEYFRRQCYVSIECDELTATNLEEFALDETVVFSTDFPHTDSKYPDAITNFLKLPLTLETKRKVLWANCARLYGFVLLSEAVL